MADAEERYEIDELPPQGWWNPPADANSTPHTLHLPRALNDREGQALNAFAQLIVSNGNDFDQNIRQAESTVAQSFLSFLLKYNPSADTLEEDIHFLWDDVRLLAPEAALYLDEIEGMTDSQRELVAVFASVVEEEPDLPSKAPELYRERKPREELSGEKENAGQFALRVYGDYMANGQGIPMVYFSSVDIGLYSAFRNWKRDGASLEGLKVYARGEQSNSIASRVFKSKPQAIEAVERLSNMLSAIKTKLDP